MRRPAEQLDPSPLDAMPFELRQQIVALVFVFQARITQQQPRRRTAHAESRSSANYFGRDLVARAERAERQMPVATHGGGATSGTR